MKGRVDGRKSPCLTRDRGTSNEMILVSINLNPPGGLNVLPIYEISAFINSTLKKAKPQPTCV